MHSCCFLSTSFRPLEASRTKRSESEKQTLAFDIRRIEQWMVVKAAKHHSAQVIAKSKEIIFGMACVAIAWRMYASYECVKAMAFVCVYI